MMRLIITAIMLLLPVIAAQGQTITVDDDGPADYSSIQDAILASTDGDVIEVQPGTYYEKVYFYGKAVTLTGSNPNDANIVAQTVIDATGQDDSVVTFAWGEGPDSVITGFTITEGDALYGSGLCCWQSSPTIVKNVIYRNGTDQDWAAGGGIYCYQSSAHIEENLIAANYLRGDYASGGGIYCFDSSVEILNNDIVTNGCLGGSNSIGGGIYCALGCPIISDNKISHNGAELRGGGIYCDSTAATITNNSIVVNHLNGDQGEGPGICVADTWSEEVYPEISYNYIHFNMTPFIGKGGGIACMGSSPEIFNNVISNNRLDEPGSHGGGVYCDANSSPTIYSNTISTNRASAGGGIYFPQGSSPLIKDNIIVKNIGGGVYWKYTSPTEFSYNCVWGNIGGDYTGWAVAGPGDIRTDPLFAESPGGYYHLKSESGRWDAAAEVWVEDDVTSGCINRADPTVPIGAEPYPNGGRLNIGAYGGTAEASKSAEIPTTYCTDQIPGDITGDCRVDFADIEAIAASWLEVENPQSGMVEQWTAEYPDQSGYAEIMAVDGLGSVYVIASRRLIKYDPNGNLGWTAYTGPSTESKALAVDSTGNVYVVSGFSTSKYAPDSNEPVWSASDGLYGRAIAIDRNDNIYVSGMTLEGLATAKYHPDSNQPVWVGTYCDSQGYYTECSTVDGEDNLYATAWDSDGNYIITRYGPDSNEPLWAARSDALGPDDRLQNFWFWAMAADSQGNVYLVGSSSIRPVLADYTTIKYSPDSNMPVWVRRYSGDGYYNAPCAIAVDSQDNVYVTGVTESWWFGSIADCSTVKYDPNGRQLWVARYNGPVNGSEGAYDIAIDSNDNIYVLAWSQGWNEDNGISWDLVLLKYDSAGNELQRLSNERVNEGFMVERAGSVYVGGYDDYGVVKYAPGDVCPGNLESDLNGSCKVDFADFAETASRWLECNLDPPVACF